jgi:dTDP-4-dehydrorhamnose 3,5-epimerase
MEIIAADGLPAVRIITPRRHRDDRGFFSEVWNQGGLHEAGIDARFMQDNHALSRPVGTLRGLHFQIGESAQGKLIRCSKGRIFDVAVDIRHGSPTFGRFAAVELSAENWRQVYVPVGFAHGYCTLEPDTEVIYKVTAYYDPASERGLLWNDPAIGIAWPVTTASAVIAERDATWPRLRDLPAYFVSAEHPDR